MYQVILLNDSNVEVVVFETTIQHIAQTHARNLGGFVRFVCV